jgi:transcriptional regulator
MGKSVEEEMLEKLDLILRVLALQVAADKSITERVFLLKLAGLDTRTIAETLGTTDATVRALSKRARRRTAPSRRKA